MEPTEEGRKAAKEQKAAIEQMRKSFGELNNLPPSLDKNRADRIRRKLLKRNRY